MALPAAVERHYRRRVRWARAVATVAASSWAQVDRDAIAASWRAGLPRIVATLQAAKRSAASEADEYLDAVLAEQGLDADRAGSLNVAAFAEDAADGRPLLSLLFQPAVATLTAMSRGLRLSDAMFGGRLAIDRIVRTEVADTGRLADGAALAARPSVGGYVRMLQAPSCPRCAILAGRWYRWSAGFDRHPLCDCVHIPANESGGQDMTVDPMTAFRAGQIHGLTRAQTKALEDGADMSRLINVHRKNATYTAGGRHMTRELTGRGRRRGAPRPTPEQIYRDATSRDDAVRLLKRFAYIR